jgi:hypothetical protein
VVAGQLITKQVEQIAILGCIHLYALALFLGTLHQQDRRGVIMAHQPHKMNVKQQWQLWLPWMKEYLQMV